MLPTLPRLIIVSSVVLLVACGGQTAEEHLNAAKQYKAANNSNAAILELKNAIQKDPTSGAARYELGRLYVELGRFESAEKELNRAMELGYDPATVLPLLSLAYQQTGAQNALVELDYNQSGMSASEAVRVGFYKLLALIDLQKKSEARALIAELSELDTASVYRGLASTYSLILDEEYAEALENTKALRKQSPANEDVLKLLVKLHLSQQQREEAVEVFENLQRISPDDTEIQFTFLALLMDMRRFEQAEPIVDSLIEINPEHGLLNQFKGIVLADKSDFETALVHLDKAIINGQDNNIVRLLAGYSAYRVENYLDAVKHLGLLVNELPPEHPGLRVLADSQLLLGQSQDASNVLSRIQGDGEQDAQLFSRAGYQLIRQGDIEEAREMVARGDELGTTTEELLQLGVLQLTMNDVAGLIKLEQAAEQEPENIVTQQTLASAYLLAGEFDKAAALAEEWKTLQPQSTSPYLLAGEVALKQDDLALAEQNFMQAKEVAPNQAEPKLAMVNLAIAKGETAQALDDVAEIYADYPDNPTALSIYYLLARGAGDTTAVANAAVTGLSQYPDNEKLRLTTANIQLAEQQFSEAIGTLSPIIPTSETSAEYWAVKGQALLRMEKLDEALAHYRAWTAFAPLNKDANLGVLLVLDTQRKFEDALAVTTTFLKDRADTQMDILAAYFLAVLGRGEESRQKLDDLPEDILALPFIRGIQARIALQDNRFTDAAEHAEVAFTATPNLRNLVMFMAALEASNQGEKAYTTLKQYYEENGSDPRARLLLAERMIGRDRENAITLYEQTVDDLPNNIVVLNNLAYLYYEDGKYDQALPLAERAVEMQPSMPEAVDTLAQIHVAKSDLKRARALYDTVINAEVNSDEVVINYVSLLMKMGDLELAERRVNQREWQSDDARSQAQALIPQT